ncbi:MAG: hypothetical protein IAX21_02060 [Candidatus Bathyarchaeota archaeon]|nr:MAG: hypothetical protein IAX21_02060 [Candidatus Bathyarchaeota archaeon]
MSNRFDAGKGQKDWNIFFADIVDDSLKQVFKKEGTKVIYDFLEKQAQLKLEEIANKPEVFSDNLAKLMMSASTIIEKHILKNLYSELGINFEEKKGYKFADYIKYARREN